MWDVYFIDKVMAMVQTGAAGPAAAQKLRNDVESLNGAEEEEDDGDYNAHIEDAIQQSAGSTADGCRESKSREL